MKRKTNSQYLLAGLAFLIGIAIPLPAEGQWIPFSAKFREQKYRSLPSGSQELISEFRGVLHRTSSGSEMRTIHGPSQEKKHSIFKDSATGQVHQINHALRESKAIQQLSLPLLPSSPPAPSGPASKSVQTTEVINGVECVGKPVVVNGQSVPGTIWVSDALQLMVKQDITFPNGMRWVVEFYDFQYTEPGPSHFEIPEDYTRYNDLPSLSPQK